MRGRRKRQIEVDAFYPSLPPLAAMNARLNLSRFDLWPHSAVTIFITSSEPFAEAIAIEIAKVALAAKAVGCVTVGVVSARIRAAALRAVLTTGAVTFPVASLTPPTPNLRAIISAATVTIIMIAPLSSVAAVINLTLRLIFGPQSAAI
jgi:hypothetical protein